VTLREVILERVRRDHNIARGAPKSLTAQERHDYNQKLRPAIWLAARQIETELGITWETEWRRAARRAGVRPDLIEVEALKPNPFGCHGGRDRDWRKRLLRVEELCINARSFRNGVRGFGQASDVFKKNAGYTKSVRTGKHRRDSSTGRILPSPPAVHFDVLNPPIATSLLDAIGFVPPVISLASFEPAISDRYRSSRSALEPLWESEKADVESYRRAHRESVRAAEARFVEAQSVGSPTGQAATSSSSSTAYEASQTAEVPVKWAWRNNKGDVIDNEGRIVEAAAIEVSASLIHIHLGEEQKLTHAWCRRRTRV
jgi:hypothetical protein